MTTPIRLKYGLPFVTAVLTWNGTQITFENALIDTGSRGTLLSVDRANEVGLTPEPEDTLRQIFGVGGSEFVIAKRVPAFGVGLLMVTEFEIELGALDYGLQMDAIIETDFLTDVAAVIDFESATLTGKPRNA